MGPGTLGLAAVQINVLVNTSLAATQQEGAVSWLQFAFRLMYLPIGLFGVSIATAALPDLSRHAADADKAAMRGTISSRAADDADAERAGDDRADRARAADRRAGARARQVHAARFGGHRRGADVLRAGPARLLGGQDRLAELLRARRQPHAGDRQRRQRPAQPRPEPRASCRSSATAASRSARPSPRCSMPSSLLALLSRRIDGLDGRACWSRSSRSSPPPR